MKVTLKVIVGGNVGNYEFEETSFEGIEEIIKETCYQIVPNDQIVLASVEAINQKEFDGKVSMVIENRVYIYNDKTSSLDRIHTHQQHRLINKKHE